MKKLKAIAVIKDVKREKLYDGNTCIDRAEEEKAVLMFGFEDTDEKGKLHLSCSDGKPPREHNFTEILGVTGEF